MTNLPQSPFPKGKVSPPFEKGRSGRIYKAFCFFKILFHGKQGRKNNPRSAPVQGIHRPSGFIVFLLLAGGLGSRPFVPAGRRDATSRGDGSGPLDLRRPADLAALFPSPCGRSCLSPGRTPLPGPIAPGGQNPTPPRPDANSFRPPPTGRNRPYPLWSFSNKMIGIVPKLRESQTDGVAS